MKYNINKTNYCDFNIFGVNRLSPRSYFIPYGQNFTLSGLRVFGLANGKKPKESEILSAERVNDTTAKIKWQKQSDVTGYCIRIGIAPDKLYNSVLLYGQTDYTVTFLNQEAEEYYFAVDTFNESGITQGKVNKLTK